MKQKRSIIGKDKITIPKLLKSTTDQAGPYPGHASHCAVTRAMAKNAKEELKDCKQCMDVLVDLSDSFLNYDHDMQNASDTNPKARTGSEKQDTIDGPVVSLLK